MMRLDKFLREAGVGTSQFVREEIKGGRVTVNGNIEKNPLFEVCKLYDCIKYNNIRVDSEGLKYIMFNKPKGYISARRDADTPTVFECFKDEDMGGIFHVGRLDKDTEGIMIFTNDGEFNNTLMRPESHIEKEYYFIALGNLTKEDIESIEKGLYIGKNEPITKPAKLNDIINTTYSKLSGSELECIGVEVGNDKYDPKIVKGYIIISEGRKHQVKRMLKAKGCHVIYLKRVSIGKLKLDNNLKNGEYRFMTKEEVKIAMKSSNL